MLHVLQSVEAFGAISNLFYQEKLLLTGKRVVKLKIASTKGKLNCFLMVCIFIRKGCLT